MSRFIPAVALACSFLVLGACAKKPEVDALGSTPWGDAEAALLGPKGEIMGRALFADAEAGVLIRIEATGLSPGWHGVHLHMVADCSDGGAGFKASGGHVDPEDHEHGLENPAGSEKGDLPNLYAGADGRAVAEFFRSGINLRPSEAGAAANGPFPLIDDDGFSLIIHADGDDHRTQPIGGAGDRVACAAVKR